MGWPWIVLLALAAAVVAGAEWTRLEALVGIDARRGRDRRKQKSNLRLIRTEKDEFEESVQRDLENLPTFDERDRP